MAETKITEKYEYLTDIITSFGNKEQRIRLREKPRHTYSFDYSAMTLWDGQWLRAMMRTKINDVHLVPMWHNEMRLTEDYVGNKLLFIRPEHMMNMEGCNMVKVFVKDDYKASGVNTLLDIDAINTNNTLHIKDAYTIDFLDMRNAFLYPVKRVALQPSSTLQYVYSNGSEVALNFEDLNYESPVAFPNKFLEEYDVEDSANRFNLPLTHDGLNLFPVSPQWISDDSLSLTVDKWVTRLDNETGSFFYDVKTTNSYDIMTFDLTLMNKPAINNMIRFFRKVCGRWKPFYVPSWANDIEVWTDIRATDNYILTDFHNLDRLYNRNGRRKKIVIFTKDWKSYIYDIFTWKRLDFIGKNGNVKHLCEVILNKQVGVSLPKSNILMVSFLNFVRFDSDELVLNYETTNEAQTTLVMKEVDE